MRIKRIVFLLLCLALSEAQGMRACAASIGDSIIYKARLANSSPEACPAHLQKLLGANDEVGNFGNSWRGYFLYTRHGKEMRGCRYMNRLREALAWEPRIVIRGLGINDCGASAPLWAKGACPKFKASILTPLNDYRTLPTHPLLCRWTRLAGLALEHWCFTHAAPFLMQREWTKAAREGGVVEINLQNTFNVSTHLLSDKATVADRMGALSCKRRERAEK